MTFRTKTSSFICFYFCKTFYKNHQFQMSHMPGNVSFPLDLRRVWAVVRWLLFCSKLKVTFAEILLWGQSYPSNRGLKWVTRSGVCSYCLLMGLNLSQILLNSLHGHTLKTNTQLTWLTVVIACYLPASLCFDTAAPVGKIFCSYHKTQTRLEQEAMRATLLRKTFADINQVYTAN